VNYWVINDIIARLKEMFKKHITVKAMLIFVERPWRYSKAYFCFVLEPPNLYMTNIFQAILLVFMAVLGDMP